VRCGDPTCPRWRQARQSTTPYTPHSRIECEHLHPQRPVDHRRPFGLGLRRVPQHGRPGHLRLPAQQQRHERRHLPRQSRGWRDCRQSDRHEVLSPLGRASAIDRFRPAARRAAGTAAGAARQPTSAFSAGDRFWPGLGQFNVRHRPQQPVAALDRWRALAQDQRLDHLRVVGGDGRRKSGGRSVGGGVWL
jgi:hypothetical protein